MGLESSDVVRLDFGSLLQGQTRIVKLKSAYKPLIIGPRGLQCEANFSNSWAENLLMWSGLTFGPSFKLKRG